MDHYRQEINEITKQMMELLEQRLDVSKKIGQYKKEHQIPLTDRKRELELIQSYLLEKYPEQSEVFLEMLFTLSKEVQK